MKELKYIDILDEGFKEKLPFIDDNSDNYDKNPEAIKWLKNGELGGGLNLSNKRDFQSLGSLNRVPYQLYQDLIIIHENTKLLRENINSLDIKLGDFDEHEIKELVENLKDYDVKLINMEQDIRNFQFDIQNFEYRLDKSDTLLGNKNDLIINNVTMTLYVLKLLVGNDVDTDLNGNFNEGLEATGLFYRILTVSGEVNKLSQELEVLKTAIGGNDVVELVDTVTNLNESIGEYTNSVNIATRLDNIDTSIQEIESDIDKIDAKFVIKTDDDTYTLVDFKTEYDLFVAKVDEIIEQDKEYHRLNTIKIENIESNIGAVETSVDGIKTEIGIDDTTGLKKRIKDVETKNSELESNNHTLNENMNSVLMDMQTINQKIGDEQSGITGSISAMSDILLGEDGESGVKKDVDDLKLKVFEDAPKDGNSYLRKDGTWIQKAFALCKYSDSDYNQIDVNGEIKIPLSTLTPLVKDGINIDSNNDVVVSDTGYFDIRFNVVVKDLTKSYIIDMYNGLNKLDSSSVGFSSIGGNQVIVLESLFKATKGDKIHFNITPSDEDSKGNAEFRFILTLQPAN